MSDGRLDIAAKYVAFAVIASACNLGVQWLATAAWPWGAALPVSMALGTAAGLGCKYVLDRVWIFRFDPGSARAEVATAARYGATGLLTTALFWGTELAFHAAVDHPAARYAGGALGLALGYALKYHLDKHHVFRH